ncbi:MAG: hypothetical protein ACOCRZ_02155 [Halothermotrichaceae bacterium]
MDDDNEDNNDNNKNFSVSRQLVLFWIITIKKFSILIYKEGFL